MRASHRGLSLREQSAIKVAAILSLSTKEPPSGVRHCLPPSGLDIQLVEVGMLIKTKSFSFACKPFRAEP